MDPYQVPLDALNPSLCLALVFPSVEQWVTFRDALLLRRRGVGSTDAVLELSMGNRFHRNGGNYENGTDAYEDDHEDTLRSASTAEILKGFCVL